eukprot:GHVQ01037931.1.p1 GENE.GHVQ01037931.1~~GHVQ01037931.1.p1  ORF type:complete len:710 (-),score=111.48 GHVQ01037931.1:2052-4181(-)
MSWCYKDVWYVCYIVSVLYLSYIVYIPLSLLSYLYISMSLTSFFSNVSQQFVKAKEDFQTTVSPPQTCTSSSTQNEPVPAPSVSSTTSPVIIGSEPFAAEGEALSDQNSRIDSSKHSKSDRTHSQCPDEFFDLDHQTSIHNPPHAARKAFDMLGNLASMGTEQLRKVTLAAETKKKECTAGRSSSHDNRLGEGHYEESNKERADTADSVNGKDESMIGSSSFPSWNRGWGYVQRAATIVKDNLDKGVKDLQTEIEETVKEVKESVKEAQGTDISHWKKTWLGDNGGDQHIRDSDIYDVIKDGEQGDKLSNKTCYSYSGTIGGSSPATTRRRVRLPWEEVDECLSDVLFDSPYSTVECEARVRILGLSFDRNTILQGGSPDKSFEFIWSDKIAVAQAMLVEDANLNALRFEMVPRVLKEEEFWRQYFFAISHVIEKLREDVVQRLLPRDMPVDSLDCVYNADDKQAAADTPPCTVIDGLVTLPAIGKPLPPTAGVETREKRRCQREGTVKPVEDSAFWDELKSAISEDTSHHTNGRVCDNNTNDSVTLDTPDRESVGNSASGGSDVVENQDLSSRQGSGSALSDSLASSLTSVGSTQMQHSGAGDLPSQHLSSDHPDPAPTKTSNAIIDMISESVDAEQLQKDKSAKPVGTTKADVGLSQAPCNNMPTGGSVEDELRSIEAEVGAMDLSHIELKDGDLEDLESFEASLMK